MTRDKTAPSDITRCEPSQPCADKERCLRYRASIPPFGASMADFSLLLGAGAPCVHRISAEWEQQQPEQPPKPWPSVE